MVMENNILFGLKNFEESLYLSGVLTSKTLGGNINIPGTPCLIPRPVWEDKNKLEVRVRFVFPRSKGYTPNDSQIFRKRDVLAINKPVFVLKNRVKVIDKFDFEKIEALQNYVDENEAITFQIWKYPLTGLSYSKEMATRTTSRAVLSFLNNLHINLLAKYKYASTEYCQFEDNYISKVPGNLLYFLTFISLPNCIPILNRRRVHGMGLIYRAVKEVETSKRYELSVATQIAVLLTNYLDNKFVIDGITLSSIDPLHKKSLERAVNIVKANSEFTNKEKKNGNEVLKSLAEMSSTADTAAYTTAYHATSGSITFT